MGYFKWRDFRGKNFSRIALLFTKLSPREKNFSPDSQSLIPTVIFFLAGLQNLGTYLGNNFSKTFYQQSLILYRLEFTSQNCPKRPLWLLDYCYQKKCLRLNYCNFDLTRQKRPEKFLHFDQFANINARKIFHMESFPKVNPRELIPETPLPSLLE